MHDNDIIIKVDEKPAASQWFGLSFQHLFAMFGSTVLVPILVGITPAIALLSSGLGTLAHMSVTKFKVPAYMGSSLYWCDDFTDEKWWNASHCSRGNDWWIGLSDCRFNCKICR